MARRTDAAHAPKPPSRRLPARTLTGRSEADDLGTRAIRKLREADHTEHRPAYDRFDAMCKHRDAERAEAEGLALLEPPAGQVLRGVGEAILPDVAAGGLTGPQRAIELAIIDTLASPTTASLGAASLRMEAAAKLGILQPAMDASVTAQADNSLEKMLCHQLAALHHAGMRQLDYANGGHALEVPDAPTMTRYVNTAVRCFDSYQTGMLTLLKFKTGGRQTVVVQHVHVSEGGQAVIAGSVTKEGDRVPGGGDSR